MEAPRDLFAPIEPYRQGWLDVGEGHRVFYEESGAPDGIPVLCVHGGPGSGSRPLARRFFHPRRCRVIAFDQRGAGRSQPAGCLAANDTARLVADMEALRRALAVGRWIVFGGSWGATLALCYARRHPERVAAALLRGIFLASREEIDGYLYGLRAVAPEAWRRFSEALPACGRDDLLAGYGLQLAAPEPATRLAAARAWCRYEGELLALDSGLATGPPAADEQLLAKARIQVHYLRHGCFVDADVLRRGVARLAGIPAILVHGARDRICRPEVAQALARHWPGADLRIVPGAGHLAGTEAMAAPLVRAARELVDGVGSPWHMPC